MGTGAERSNSLHNFTMPHELRWGNQRFLRCMKVNSDGQISPLRRASDQRRRTDLTSAGDANRGIRGGEIDSSPEFLHGSRKLGRTFPPAIDSSRRFSGYDGGIAATREKVMLDLQTAADEMKHAIFKDGLKRGEVYNYKDLPPPPPSSGESELIRPWNLRTRRADLKRPASRLFSPTNVDTAAAAAAAGCENGSGGEKDPIINEGDKSMRLRSGGGAAASGEKKERRKFSVALSRNEIEEDFYSLAGRRPPRRPKKRARNVQRQLDTLFPGLWLYEVTPDMYKVSEAEGR